ncbi:T Cell Receptor Beta Variable 7-9 [Manis pentadactyla]|nr:T Cell Receptor Beta Variable 7-9 [Manis pentadactyla]
MQAESRDTQGYQAGQPACWLAGILLDPHGGRTTVSSEAWQSKPTWNLEFGAENSQLSADNDLQALGREQQHTGPVLAELTYQGPIFQKTASLASAPGSLQPAATGMKLLPEWGYKGPDSGLAWGPRDSLMPEGTNRPLEDNPLGDEDRFTETFEFRATAGLGYRNLPNSYSVTKETTVSLQGVVAAI